MASSLQPSGVHAFFAVDPGGTTGIAAGHFELSGTVKRTLNEGRRMHKAAEVTGQWLSQGKQLANLINHWLFIATTEHGIQLPNCHVAFEDYTRRPQASSTNLDPVWVSAAACAFLDRPDLAIAWQQPSEAKGFATNERLKLWGLWSVGSEHRRDANRHLALLVNKVLG